MGAMAAYIQRENIRPYTVRIITKDSTVMSSPPISVTAQSGMESQKPTWLMASISSWGSVTALIPDTPDWLITVETIPCTIWKDGQHQVQAVGHGSLGQSEADKELERLFGAFGLHEGTAGLDHTGCEEEHQQPVANGLQTPRGCPPSPPIPARP